MKTTFTILFFICGFCYSSLSQSLRPTSEIINSAVLVKIANSTGSGLYLSDTHYTYFVTAFHVMGKFVENRVDVHANAVDLTSYSTKDDSTVVCHIIVDLQKAYHSGNVAWSIDRDLFIIRYGKNTPSPTNPDDESVALFEFAKATQPNITSLRLSDTALFKSISVTTEVMVIGFPKSLGMQSLPQYDFDNPIIRKGIVAGKNLKQKTIVLDCPVYKGNSGGPVMQSKIGDPRMRLIGIVKEFIPLVDTWQSQQYGITNANIANSGYSIVEPVDEIMKLIALFKK